MGLTMSSSSEFNQLINSDQYRIDYDVVSALKQEGLKESDFVEICRRLERPPNRTELGMFGVMWSEHCCYRNSKPLLQNFPTSGERILVGPGENAGVIDVGNGQRLVFKIESHNHPSAIEPFQGAATGVGGILRDIFTMGARPIALLNALRFGPLEEENNVSLLEGVVSGIAHYGNCIGVPTIGGEIGFDSSYSGNPLVNAMAIGLMETNDIVCSGASGINFPVLYVGSTTGRDGMGGASFASAELTESSLDDRPAVQVGDPFLEKGLIEACLQAFKTGDVVAAQDMGAAGLTCSCSEMASKGDVGIELNLDAVPAREKGMTPYEFLLSESQERMLFVIKPGSEEKLKKLFTSWGLYVEIVGKVLKENVVRVIHQNKVVANLPASALADDTPIENHDLLLEPPEFLKKHWEWNEKLLPKCNLEGAKSIAEDKILSWDFILLKLLDSPTIASKKWIYNQYDYQVQSNTVVAPGDADAAVIRLRPQDYYNSEKIINRGIAAVVDCPNRWVFLDPERGSIASVAESARNLSCVGAEPLAVTDNLNFSSPNNSIGYWQLAMACRGIAKACEILKTPVTGGNVSLFNETNSSKGIVPIQPTPVIGMVGLIEDLDKTCTQSWKALDDEIWLIGAPIENDIERTDIVSLSASSYLEYIHGLITGRPPQIDLTLEINVQSCLRQSISQGFIKSAHDVSDGGLLVALAESSIASGFGCIWNLPQEVTSLDRLMFAEGGSRVIVTIAPNQINEWLDFVRNFQKNNEYFSATRLGYVTPDNTLTVRLEDQNIIKIGVTDLKNTYENSIQNRIYKSPIS